MRWCLLFLVLMFPATAQAAGMDATPPSLTFAQDVTDGPSAIQTSVVTNNTGGPVAITVTGPSNPDFTVLNDDPFGDCSNQLGLFTGGKCRVRVQFDPSAQESVTDSVVVNDGSDDTTISLSGEGTVRGLTPSPTSIAFGQQAIGAGSSAPQTATFTNNGTGPVVIFAHAGRNLAGGLLLRQPAATVPAADGAAADRPQPELRSEFPG